jgi:peptidoglycan/xylan/chitin deacetylase (PgdA/CDA1 family)|tara:strand:- start:4461 stop:5378 length:918 start_codon:yes stop_codon:yes gene_type:complete
MQNSKFVISLDFELHWGVFDAYGNKYNKNILGARKAIPKILDLFNKYEIEATWATVGLLFNEKRDEHVNYNPSLKPSYDDKNLNSYDCKIGDDENSDPLHFAHSLIKLINESHGQEIACHTYSHYYCKAEGQNIAEFDEDIKSSVRIAKEKFNLNLKSFVFPKNEVTDEYIKVLKNNSIEIFRDSYRNKFSSNILERLYRLFNTYFALSKFSKNSVQEKHGVKAIYGDRFLRPYTKSFMNNLMLRRIKDEMLEAAQCNSIYHLWWHPHNFGQNLDQNLNNLEQILVHYTQLKSKYNMSSICMKNL